MLSKIKDAFEKLTRSNADKASVEDAIKDIQRALLSSDVDVQLVMQLADNIRKKSFESLPPSLTRKEHVIKVVYSELVTIMGEKKSDVALKPKKVLMIGLFGSGKTSTSAKLANFYKKKGLKPFLVCCDTVRPAAFEQLQQLAQKIEVPFYGEKNEKDPRKVLKNALHVAKGDIIIVDSSGRSALDNALIEEIVSLNTILKPDEKILVIPADIGQAAKQQASAFHDALGITDVIVTKTDATARGGGSLTACHATGAKIKFITVGETVDDLQQYDPEKFVARLLGMPDLETLLEKAKSSLDEKKAEKMITGDFTIEDFCSQIEGVQKMGSMSQIIEMAGLGRLAKKGNVDEQADKMKRWRYMIQSMSLNEKQNPDIINSSRIRRIAAGSGCKDADVRELLSNYNKTKKLMKGFNPNKLKRGDMSSIMRQLGMK
ncbi:MAG TPA: signal recognition particle receptor subunit alpha [archaeon]|nr:signal recognition particle receptor subunit alpha [archaeon]